MNLNQAMAIISKNGWRTAVSIPIRDLMNLNRSQHSMCKDRLLVSIPIRDLMNLNRTDYFYSGLEIDVSIPIRDLMNLNLIVSHSALVFFCFNPY